VLTVPSRTRIITWHSDSANGLCSTPFRRMSISPWSNVVSLRHGPFFPPMVSRVVVLVFRERPQLDPTPDCLFTAMGVFCLIEAQTYWDKFKNVRVALPDTEEQQTKCDHIEE